MNLNLPFGIPNLVLPRRNVAIKSIWPVTAAESKLFSTRSFILCVGTLVSVLLVYNLLIHQTAKNSQRRQLLAAIDRIPADTDSLFLGNSLVEAGCDAASFRLAWTRNDQPIHPANIALGATSPVEHYLILKKALSHNLHLKFVIYGFFDDQLNAPVHGDWADLVGNRALSYYFPDEAASMYAPNSTLKKWQLRIANCLPMLSERSSLWGKVEMARRRLDEIGMPKHQTNRYGRVEDFSALEASDTSAFNQRCGAVVEKQMGFSLPIQKIIALSQAQGAKVILVEMPMPSRHRTVFYSSAAWIKLKSYVAKLAADKNLVLVSAADWLQDDANFEDATHLNADGAKLFSAKLSEKLANLTANPTQVAQEVDRQH
jgi:hypothetical protein